MLDLYGLLHLAEGEKSLMNAYAPDFERQIRLYASNAVLLGQTLKDKGIKFTLLTNSKDYIVQTLEQIKGGETLEVKEINFSSQIPGGIRFYSAHFKIDVFRYFSTLSNDTYIGYCDLDMVAINKIPDCLKFIVSENIPLCYDISDQVIPAYGHEVIISDMKKISASAGEGRWIGGEFIAGPPDFFARLVSEISSVYDNYVREVNNLHHIGDEMFVSVALEQLRRKGFYIADAGTLGIVGRYFSSSKILHPQKPFEYYKNCFLLHLPNDKEFMAEFCSQGIINDALFMQKYSSYAGSQSAEIKRKVKKLVGMLQNKAQSLIKTSRS